MEASPLPTSGNDNWAEQYDQSLNLRREQIRDFLSAQQQRLQQVESQLSEHLQPLAEELTEGRAETQQTKEELDQRFQQIDRETKHLEGLKEDLAARQARWEQLRQQSEQQQQSLLEQIRQQQADLNGRHEELLNRQTEVNEAEAKLHQQQRAFELARGEHEAELQQLNRQRERLDAEQSELRVRTEQLAAARAELDVQRRRIEEGGAEVSGADMARRYEMAMEDLRELKAENAELQRQLDKAAATPAAAQGPAPAAAGPLDWEAEKQRILASLEDDFDEEDEDDRAERVRIDEVIETTDRLLAEKDNEIGELKQLLETQSTKVGSVAIGAAALGEMLDSDTIVQEERENLKRVQEEWREKLRKAEVDISVERAKIARDRAELEDRIRLLEQRGGSFTDEPDATDPSEKPVRGRWLSRLGLGSEDQDQ